MTDTISNCIFCGRSDQDPHRLTWEHLWPRWSHKKITRSMRLWRGLHVMQRIEPARIDPEETKTVKQGGDIHDFQVRCVCGGDDKTCNNGWMRELENRARPIMAPLLDGAKVRLSPDDQRVVAGWCALKAMVAEYGRLAHVTSTQVDRDRMMATQLPPEEGWGIWIGYYERSAWPGYLGANPFAFWPEPERAHLLGVPTTDFNGQATFQVVKKLFVQVIRCQVPSLVEKWRFDNGAANVLRKIWPPSGYSIVWPPPVMSDGDADYVASAFARSATQAVQRRLARSPGLLQSEPPKET